MNDRIIKEIDLIFNELKEEGRVIEMDKYIQHGNCTTLRHCLGVAYYSARIQEVCRLKCNRASLIKSALIHDYHLYDWHEKDKSHSLHGFKHPKTALKNADKDFKLNDIERDAIINHMFPLIPVMPKFSTGKVVCLADKMCATYEIFRRNPYHRLYNTIKKGIKE